MRTLKISLLFFILPITISSQWYQQNSGTTNNLYNVQFVNEQVGWATTDQVIYKTTDGGQNWQLQYTQNPIFQIFFNNENVGWMVSWLTSGSALLKTIDGGDNWIQSYVGSYEYIRDIEFINPDTGWFAGEQTISFGRDGIVGNAEFPVLFKETTDGGITWVDKNFSPNHPGGLRQIEAIDYMHLIVAGYDTLFKSTNGGNSWQKIPIFCSDNYEFQFFNMNLGWARGNNVNGGILYKTTDGGYFWIQQIQPFYDYQFITPSVGWYTIGNEIYHSTDGGYSWTLQNSNTNNSLYDIFFLDNNNGWAVGGNGTILHTNNGGTPVELISFTAEVSVSTVELKWLTATETNNQGFEILRFAQNDSDGWNKIGFVPGHGTTTETQHYSFTDNDVKPGKYQYKLKQIDYDGTFEYSQIVEVEIPFPNKFSLSQNYPNPFNPVTKIKFTIPTPPVSSPLVKGRTKEGFVTLKVYDILGKEVATLVNEEKPAGEYEVEFNAANLLPKGSLTSGIYFYQLTAGDPSTSSGQVFKETRKMVLLK